MTAPVPHPLHKVLQDWLPACDFDVMRHGFTDYSRDYLVEIAIYPNYRYELLFTHVTECSYRTLVRDDVWSSSWDDLFIDHEAWADAGQPEGLVWYLNGPVANPGIAAIEMSPLAKKWESKLGKPYFEVTLETNLFFLSLVFHGLRWRRIAEDPPENWRRHLKDWISV